MAKRGYTSETIRGGASDWDVSRPFSSYLRLLGALLSHPVRFYEVLPKVPDPRAPGLFVAFCGIVAAVFWLLFFGWISAVGVLVLALPASLVLAGFLYFGTFGGRYEYVVTWRTTAYPFGFALPFLAVPYLRWFVLVLFVFLLAGIGLRTVREVSSARAFLASGVATLLIAAPLWWFAGY